MAKESRRIHQIADSCGQRLHLLLQLDLHLDSTALTSLNFTKQFNARTADQGDFNRSWQLLQYTQTEASASLQRLLLLLY